MQTEAAISRLRAHEQELRGLGIARLSLFGSAARGEAGPDSDIDLAVSFDAAAGIGMFKLYAIEERLREIVGGRIDLVSEPARRRRFQDQIDRDRVRVF
ncbi:nucleotidyltransferase family protein [uncultured Sphingomonas sp.]|uniref:nucleotidyltransferase family protein n=1 Tax=uncultured Sphingomonas sp. TaxID=158754 RepID=UPI00262EA7D8|nr:nucleotidyltransferase family protein [uncultured Sphingomonas sp.]